MTRIERDKMDALAAAFMDLFPDLEPMSLDDFLIQHAAHIPSHLFSAGNDILRCYPEYNDDETLEVIG